MEWQQIVMFDQVARLGSFSRAAEAVFRTQSAVSQQIRKLEDELGCRLLERTGKKQVRPTRAGESFLEFCRTVLGERDRLGQELARLEDPLAGRLRLAAPFTTLYNLLPRVLTRYLDAFPRVELGLVDRPQREALEMCREGRVDLALVLESRLPAGFLAARWQRVEPVVVVGRAHPLAGRESVSLAEVADHPLILPTPGPNRERLDRRLRDLGGGHRVVLESSNVELSARYAEMGLGVAFATTTRDPALLAGRAIALVPVDDFGELDHLVAAWPADRPPVPVQRALVDMLAEAPAGATSGWAGGDPGCPGHGGGGRAGS